MCRSGHGVAGAVDGVLDEAPGPFQHALQRRLGAPRQAFQDGGDS